MRGFVVSRDFTYMNVAPCKSFWLEKVLPTRFSSSALHIS